MRSCAPLLLLAGCSLFESEVEPHPAFFQLSPAKVELPPADYNTPPQFGSFLVENTGADTLYVSLVPASLSLPPIAEPTDEDTDAAPSDPTDLPADDGSGLVVVDMLPHNTLAPGQRDLIEVSLDPRVWRWYTTDLTPALKLEVGYFFSGQTESEPEQPSSSKPPEFISAVYDLFVHIQIDCDLDDDGFDSIECSGSDCDDRLRSVFPGAVERCDGFDGDCDGATDEGAEDELAWFYDADRDNYGDPEETVRSCNRPSASWVNDGTDCDDDLLIVHPGATEICDGVDNDCDAISDEGCD
jgi:hypothetical protein